jgi:hypothetical protein
MELLLAGGASAKAVSRKFDAPYYALNRHWNNHVTDERKASLVMGPVQRQALAARVAEESESILDHHKATRCGLYARFDAAIEAGDNMAVALLAGRLTEVNNSIGRLTGQIATSPLVQQTTINNNLYASPEYIRLRSALLQLGRDHPDVRPALVAMLKGLDAEPNSTSAPAPVAPRVIEHEGSAND